MRGASRLPWIALGLLFLSVPVAGVCSGMAGWAESCAMAAMPEMEHCAAETELTAGCCRTSEPSAGTDLVLTRPDDGVTLPPATFHGAGPGAPEEAYAPAVVTDTIPPPRPAPYRLLSALLL